MKQGVRLRLMIDSASSSTTPTKERDTCVTCDKPTTEESLECVWCDRFQHRACVKIKGENFSALCDLPKNIVFFVLSVSTSFQLHSQLTIALWK